MAATGDMQVASAPAFARIAPFALFMAFVAVLSWPEGPTSRLTEADVRWLVIFRGVAVAAVLGILWRHYLELHDAPLLKARQWLLALASGAAVFVVWITFDSGWAAFDSGASAGFSPLRPDGSIDPMLAFLRLAGLALVVPVMEELFWRSFLLRWIVKREFLTVDPRHVSFAAFAISSALFASEHSQWFAGLVAGMVYNAIYMRSGNLWVPIVSHATTNGLLGIWILATGNWQFW
jgi:CAAX prenyl protease-like protein